MKIAVLYFASLRDAAGCVREDVEVPSGGLAALYDTLQARHGFALPRARIRVAVNGAFAEWSYALRGGEEVAFIPPVSGG
jgi:molybdopterin synthase sulfur carrier subunit